MTLVPDDDKQLTSDHGWELTEKREIDRLRSVVERLRQVGCRVSLFMDADTEKIGQLEHIGAQRIELYTDHSQKLIHFLVATEKRQRIFSRSM